MNALKYASAFPVIIISSMQKSSKAASLKGLPYDGYFSDTSLFRLWLFFVALNSFYSFYWDIYHDWNLIQIQPSGRAPTLTLNTASGSGVSSAHSRPNSGPLSPTIPKIGSTSKGDMPHLSNSNLNGSPSVGSNSNSSNSSNSSVNSIYSGGSGSTHSSNNNDNSGAVYSMKQRRIGMRSYLHYEDRLFYIMAVILDFLLRTTWMLKLVSNIQIEEYEGGVFTMECLEVLRRWIWVLFRLESEMVKRAGYMEASLSPAGMVVGGAGGDMSMSENAMMDREGGGNTIMMEELESWQK
ncbi:hypothetical protein BGZ80_002857 [Entomortierella chlamydospora]|uniref:EXS domain-containing protein n=1 Tax=Entomortierella chlamydospora TaxID=101097 RepID=A0A9P6SXB3_9FUNG|nr:hypothetical protein BGZ79_001303 [Entomortierella chlamydospora]KAG0008976.1 hypothetical protein BGZ80_002857 [Entomortierella chlamydospora]